MRPDSFFRIGRDDGRHDCRRVAFREKGVRLKSQEAVIRSDHVLMVPLDAEMTPPIFSISWWSRVKPASSVDPPGYLLKKPDEMTRNAGVELNDLARRPE